MCDLRDLSRHEISGQNIDYQCRRRSKGSLYSIIIDRHRSYIYSIIIDRHRSYIYSIIVDRHRSYIGAAILNHLSIRTHIDCS